MCKAPPREVVQRRELTSHEAGRADRIHSNHCLILGLMASIAVLLFKRDVVNAEWREGDLLRRRTEIEVL
jgi:hypothetical protein